MKPFKAYTVSDDEGSVVRYAQHAVVARRDGACELDEDFGYVTCRRAPEFDHFYPHGPSDLQKFENGWWFECSFCGSGRACVEGGMYSDGRFFCEGCVEGFTDMRPVETPRYVSQFFGGDYVLGQDGQWQEVLPPVSALPLANTSRHDTPYVWFNAFR